MKTRIDNLLVWQEDGSFLPGSITVEGERIVENGEADTVIDGKGMLACPGLIDLHTHGRYGADFCDATEQQLLDMAADYARYGTTAVAPTLASDSFEGWQKAAARIKAAQTPAFVAFHLEGRYISPKKRGAHDPKFLVTPNIDEVSTMGKLVAPWKMRVTFAPELDEDGSFRRACVANGYLPSISHTDADYAIASAAIADGVNSFSHLYNTMPPLHHRAGGPIAAALTSDAYVELISDGVHVSGEMIALAYRAKGTERILLVSDSMAGTGCPDGDYYVGGLAVVVKDGKALTPEGNLAGSTLNLFHGVQNFAKFCNIPFGKAIRSASAVPAAYIGLAGELGTLRAGARADILLLENENVSIPTKVMQAGKFVS